MTKAAKAKTPRKRIVDMDNPPLTAAELKRMRPAAEVLPDLVARARGERGPQKAPTKVMVSMRLDADVVARLRASGSGWQTRANAMLDEALEREGKRKVRG